MKTRLYLTAGVIAVLLFTANVSQAAFPIKKSVKQMTALKAEADAATRMNDVANATASNATAPVTKEQTVRTGRKQSFVSRLVNRVLKPESSNTIPQLSYIILAIFPLGWLGMGLNDNFEGYDWVISLLLYILGFLPGLIYTLIKMGKYY